MRRLRKLLALPLADQWLAAEAAVWLALAQLLLAVLPFRWIAISLGPLARERSDGAVAPVDLIRQAQVRRIGQTVERTARHLPWTALCLPQALAARAMLGRRGIPATVHFGMALSDDETTDQEATEGGRRMLAHAWVTVGRTGVVGTPAAGRFAVVARFTHETGNHETGNHETDGQTVG
ncbi:lasso peptide biosynthesis B2 protein [Azospirillum cavernae]|nr:lasso peptide biosynthesis B2 protein [Azospirillum cavernae]